MYMIFNYFFIIDYINWFRITVVQYNLIFDIVHLYQLTKGINNCIGPFFIFLDFKFYNLGQRFPNCAPWYLSEGAAAAPL